MDAHVKIVLDLDTAAAAHELAAVIRLLVLPALTSLAGSGFEAAPDVRVQGARVRVSLPVSGTAIRHWGSWRSDLQRGGER